MLPTGEGHHWAKKMVSEARPGQAGRCTSTGDSFGVRWMGTFISIAIQILECVLDKYWHHYGIKKIPLKKEISVFRKDFLF